MADSKITKFENDHKGDWYTLIKIYQSDGRFYQTWLFYTPLSFSAIFTIVALCLDLDTYSILDKDIFPLVNSIVPSLLGFNLGGFMLVVGFGSSEVLKSMTLPLSTTGFSFYQKMISVLGYTVFIQILTLLVNLIFLFVSRIDILVSNELAKACNAFALFSLTLLIFYSAAQLFLVAKHVFLFGQTIQMDIRVKAYIDQQDEDADM